MHSYTEQLIQIAEGAERAVIINADSKELPVLRILGANSMYDIVKFNTETDKKTI